MYKRFSLYIFLVLCIFGASPALNSQSYATTITTLDSEYNLNGLSKYRTHIDQFGFYWMVSKYGLDRYDGHEVINVPGLKEINVNNLILDLFEARDTQLWVFSGNTANNRPRIKGEPKLNGMKWDGYTDLQIIHPISTNKINTTELFENAPFSVSDIFSISQNGFKLYLSLKNKELYEYDTEFIKVGYLPNAHLYKRSWVITDQKKLVYIDNQKLRLCDLNGRQLKEIDLNAFIYTIHLSNDGSIQASTYKSQDFAGMIISKELEIVESVPQNIYSLPFYTIRNDGNYFKFVNGNLLIVNKEGEELFNYTSYFDLEKNNHLQMFETATLQDDVDFALLRTKSAPLIASNFISPFTNYLDSEKTSYSIRGICSAPDGRFLVNGGPRSYLFSPGKKEPQILKYPKLDQQKFVVARGNFYDAKHNSFWVNFAAEIVEYGPDNKILNTYKSEKNRFSDLIRLTSNSEMIVLNEYKGLSTIDNDRNEIVPRPIQSLDHPINDQHVQQIYELNDATYLLTEHGIFQWDVTTDRIVWQQTYPDELKRVKKFDWHIEDKSKIWISTSGLGLFLWHLPQDKLTKYHVGNGLSSDVVYSIEKGADGKLWCSTTNGLNSIDLETNEIKTYLTQDGLSNYEFNSTAFHQDTKGNLYFGGLNGFTKFHPSLILSDSSNEPTTYFTNAYIDTDTTRQEISLTKKDPIIFEQGQGILEIKLSAPDVAGSSKAKYQYKFADRENQWRTIEGSIISFSNLRPGNYRLAVRAPGRKKSWSPIISTIQILVPTPFLQSKWFYLALVTAICLLGYCYARWRIYNLEKTKAKLEQEVGKRTESLQQNMELVKEQAEELQQLDKLKSRFFTNISHELRTPLTLVTNPIKQLKKIGLENDQQQLIETAYSGSQQLKKMVQRILKLSEIDSSQIKNVIKPTTLTYLVERYINPSKSAAESLGIAFDVKTIGDTNLVFLADQVKLEEIFQNIIQNALKYTREGGQINLELKLTESKLTFSCQDNGVGISESQLSKIFLKYYQSKQLSLPAQGGLGIGLALSREFAKIMNGDLTVESELGKGSTFTLQIPISLGTQAAVPPANLKAIQINTAAAAADPVINQEWPTILIVEDHEMMMLMLKSTLKQNFNIETAANGKAGLQILSNKQHNIDLVITDWMMPMMDGPTFLSKVRKTPSLENLPVIMLTARASQDDKLSILKIGVDDYIIKPFDPEELRTRVLNLLSNRRERKVEVERSAALSKMEFTTNPTADEQWLEKMKQHVLNDLKSPNFSVTDLAQAMNLGERQLRRRLKSLAGLTPGNYIKECRLLKARHLLENKQLRTVSEVCYAVGFTTPEYFSKIFYQRFGKMPSTYFS